MTRLKAEDQQKAIDECKAVIEEFDEYMSAYGVMLNSEGHEKANEALKGMKKKLSNAERMLELIIEGEK